ncbi:hypothetical protein D3C80_2114520 [compost metagenome]
MTEHRLQLLNRRFVAAGRDIDGRVDDRQVVVERRLRNAGDIEDQFIPWHRADRGHLNRLIVDDDQR